MLTPYKGINTRRPLRRPNGRPYRCEPCPCTQDYAPGVVGCPYCEDGNAPAQYELIIPQLTFDDGCLESDCELFSGSWILDYRFQWLAIATCVWYFRDDSLTYCNGSFFSIVLIRESTFANVQIRYGDIGPIIMDWRRYDAPDGACFDSLEIPQNTNLANGNACLGGAVTIVPVT